MEKKNSIELLYPELAKQWNPNLNNGLLPSQVAAHSNMPFVWVCDHGHEFVCSPDKRARGNGCPYCSNRKVLTGYNDLETKYPNISKEWDYSKNEGTPKDYTYRSLYKANWKCSTCGTEWAARIRDRADSKYKLCPQCTALKRGEEKHKRELKQRGGITDPLLLREWDYEKNIKAPNQYTPKSNESAFWVCSKCGYHYKAKISNRANRKSCACCKGKVVVAGINDLATTHPDLANEWHPTKNEKLKPSDVSYGMATKVWWICPEGHEYQATLNHRSTGTNCPVCNAGRQTSFAEQAVFFYVKKVFPDAVNRYKDIFSNGMELDIYIPSINLAIEYDGEAWHKSETLDREKEKYRVCQDNGIKLLRLKEKMTDESKNTADEFLSIVDGDMYKPDQLGKAIRLLLDRIDPETNMWTRRNPLAYHSNVDINIYRDEKEIRSYMTKIKNGSLADEYPALAREWHKLKNGNLLPEKVRPHSDIVAWWVCPDCGNEYKSTIGHRVYGTECPKCGIVKSARSKEKKVAMIDPLTEEKIRIFNSITEASKELNINMSNISMVCKGQRKRAGGYIWQYYNEKIELH